MFNPNVVVKNIVNQPTANASIALIARILMAYIFLVAVCVILSFLCEYVGFL